MGSTVEDGSKGAQCASSPSDDVLVRGRENLMTGRFSWLVVKVRPALEMCSSRLYLEIAKTVSSPRCVMDKNAQMRQARITVSRGLERSMAMQKCSRIGMVNGAHFGRLEEGGASLRTPSSKALYSISLTFQASLWRMCHALTAAA